jgi:hypothetical protein
MQVRRWEWAGALILYIGLALGITFPAITQLSTHAIGIGHGDQFENIRLIWWTQYALQNGLNPLHQSLLGYPDGFFSAPSWAEPLRIIPAFPLSMITGATAAANLQLLLTLCLNGLSAFYLCWGLWKAYTPALIGGAVFLAFPTLQGHLSAAHSGVLALYGLPILLLCLWRILREGAEWRAIVIGAGMFALTTLGSAVSVVYLIFPITLFFVLPQLWGQRNPRVLLKVAALYLLGGLLIAPFYLPLLIESVSPTRSATLSLGGWVAYSTDLLGFISSSPFTAWGKALNQQLGYPGDVLGVNSIEGAAYLGIVAVSLCGITGLRRRLKLGSARIWLVLGLGAMVFSLGPLLKWRDQPIVYSLGDYRSYLLAPYAALQTLPVFNQSRTPGRFNLITGVVMAVAVAGSLRVLYRGKRRYFLSGVILIAVVADYQLFAPVFTTPDQTPSVFEDVRKRIDIRAVFHLPPRAPGIEKDALHWQITHQKPLIAGHTVRTTPVDPIKLDFIASHLIQPTEWSAEILGLFGVDLVVQHEGNPLNFPLLYQDERIRVYEIPKRAARPGLQPTVIAPIQPIIVTLNSEAGMLRVSTLWQAKTLDPRRYKLFIHIVKDNRIVTQYDGSIEGREWVISQQSFTLPPGEYDVLSGWYDPVTSIRLTVSGDSLTAKDGLIDLGRVVIP